MFFVLVLFFVVDLFRYKKKGFKEIIVRGAGVKLKGLKQMQRNLLYTLFVLKL